MNNNNKSTFAEHAWKFIERSISVVPIAPGTKKPGQYSKQHGWRGMSDWSRYAERMPTELEIEHWESWPNAGIGVILGRLSNITAIDKDYDIPNGGDDALTRIIPYSPCVKKGEKGWTRFFRFNGERSCSFDVNGVRVLDVLADGRQTVVPPTEHPSGCSYVWISEETLDDIISVNELPSLPDDFLDQVARVLAPYQTQEDTKYQRKRHNDTDEPINTELSIAAAYYRELNREALKRLDEWVPKIVPTSRTYQDGYRCIATWRNCKNANVGIHQNGIFDFGGNYGMTPIDLVMYSHGCSFIDAADALRQLMPSGDEHIDITANKQPKAPSPMTMPWEPKKPIEEPAVVVLPSTETATGSAVAIPNFVLHPPGIIGDIAAWISATAPKNQPELAVAAAIALCATVCQRIYRSNLGNFTSLYVVMVAKSTEGKEHPQAAVESILDAAGLSHLIAGSGYTSAGAVFSALLRQPSHIAIIDEMGKLLKMSRSKGNANSEAAIDKLVEAFGKLDGVIRPPVYSSMSLRPGTEIVDRMIYNPAITLLGATTPGTFYGNLTDDLVHDGFMGRLLVIESTQPRQLVRLNQKGSNQVPERIIEWCKTVANPVQREGNLTNLAAPEFRATTVPMAFNDDCGDIMRAFEMELNQLKDQYEPDGLDVLLGRTYEKSLRLAMIAAKAVDPNTTKIDRDSVEWSIDFVRHFDSNMTRAVMKNRVASQVDAELRKLVDYVRYASRYTSDRRFARALSSGAMPRAKLLKLMKMKSKDFDQLIETAVMSGLLRESTGVEFGEACKVYYVGDE